MSAGVVAWRRQQQAPEVLLIKHAGNGRWGFPKGRQHAEELLVATALREFEEEVGLRPEQGELMALGSIRQKSGKTVHCWAFEGDWESGRAPPSNTFEMEWPRGSGLRQCFPEIDQVAFFTASVAREKINAAQRELLDRLEALLDS